MNVTAVLVFLALAAPPADKPEAAAAPAAPATPADVQKAKITVQVVSAKPGDNTDDGRIDPRLAAKLRVSLEQLGVRKPDLARLGGDAKVVGPGEAVTARYAPYSAEVTCKSVTADEITVTVELFSEAKDPKGKKKPARSLDVSTTVKLKPGQVQPFVQAAGDKKLVLFVVAAEIASAPPPKEAGKGGP
jgi:hypothetical protein